MEIVTCEGDEFIFLFDSLLRTTVFNIKKLWDYGCDIEPNSLSGTTLSGCCWKFKG